MLLCSNVVDVERLATYFKVALATSPSVEGLVGELVLPIFSEHAARPPKAKRSVCWLVQSIIFGPLGSDLSVSRRELPTVHAIDDLDVLDREHYLEILVGTVLRIEHGARAPVLVRG